MYTCCHVEKLIIEEHGLPWWVCLKARCVLNKCRHSSICTNTIRYLHDCAMMCHVKIPCIAKAKSISKHGQTCSYPSPISGS